VTANTVAAAAAAVAAAMVTWSRL